MLDVTTITTTTTTEEPRRNVRFYNGIPVEQGAPFVRAKHGKAPKYPFWQLDIGESFTLPADEAEKARKSMYMMNMRRGSKVFRSTSVDGGRRVRFWRLA